MTMAPNACPGCKQPFPTHATGCSMVKHPLICPKCNEPMFVGLTSKKARHFSNEEPECPKEAA
jgi:hypothetical protein